MPSCTARWRQILHSSRVVSGVRSATAAVCPKGGGKCANGSTTGARQEVRWCRQVISGNFALSEDKNHGSYCISHAVEMLAERCCLSEIPSSRHKSTSLPPSAGPAAVQSAPVLAGSCLPDVSHCQDSLPRSTPPEFYPICIGSYGN